MNYQKIKKLWVFVLAVAMAILPVTSALPVHGEEVEARKITEASYGGEAQTGSAAEAVYAAGAVEEVYYGDVNENGKVAADDALLVLRHCVRLAELTGSASALADVDRNGKISADDALQILQVCVRIREAVIYEEETGGSGFYSISDLYIENGEMYAVVNTVDACTLQIRILEEETETVFSAWTVPIKNSLDTTEIDAGGCSSLPEYFIVLANLLDQDGAKICSYTCLTYTANYERFLEQTTEDFPEDRVVNFDEDETNNFGVLADKVKRIESTESENQITENANGSFLFTNADSELCELKSGDEIAVFRADEDPILISAASVMCKGDTVVITPAENTELQEYYQVLKIDMVLDNTDAVIEPAPGVTLQEAAYASAEKQISRSGNSLYLYEKSYGIGTEIGGTTETKEFTFSKLYEGKSGKASVSAGMKFSLEFQLSFDVRLFSASYIELRCVLGANGHADVNVDIAIKNSPETAEISLGNITFPTRIPGLVISTPLTLPVTWSMDANADLHAGIEMSMGFSYNTSSGFQKICKKSIDTSADVGGKISFEGGPKIALKVSFLKDIVSAQIDCQCGISLDGDVTTGLTQQSGDVIHVCGLCIEGNADVFVKATAKFSYHITDWLQDTPYDGTLADWISRLGTFSYSVLNDSDSPLGGESHFYLHECENRKYKVTVTVVDWEGNEIPGASVTVKGDEKTVAELKSKESVYLYPDTYVFCAADGKNVEEVSAAVEKGANEIMISMGTEATEKPLELTEVFATQVVQFIHGDPWTEIAEAQNAFNVLGAPDHENDQNGLTLGGGGVLTVGFDMAFTDIEGADITIYEAGNDKEAVEVSVSVDGEFWYTVGVADGGTSKIDIVGAVPKGVYFQYVRLTDLGTALNSIWPGADIDAISVQVYQD